MRAPGDTAAEERARLENSNNEGEGGMNLRVARERAIDGAAERRRPDRDRDLLQALRGREPMAAEHLVAGYGERAYRLACRITGNGSDAEEVVQDAFWTVVRKIDTFRGESAFGSWLYRIVANAAYQRLRRRPSSRREISWDEVLPVFDESGRHVATAVDWSARVEDPARQVELRTALSAAIDELPAAFRAVLVLRDVEGRSNGEIADMLGLNTALVKTRVHRARLFLRKRLGELMTEVDVLAACVS
jgi:RNA polymerase sigma-70 factor (ECF subfamily)